MTDPQCEDRIDGDIAIDSDELVRTNIGWMLALAERLLRDRALAEDVVQESFVRAFDGLAGFEGRSASNHGCTALRSTRRCRNFAN